MLDRSPEDSKNQNEKNVQTYRNCGKIGLKLRRARMSSDGNAFEVIQAYNLHVDLIAPLFDAYRIFYDRNPNLERSRQFLAERIGVRDTVVFAAIENLDGKDKALGFAIMYPSFNSILASPIWILNDLYVAESARRRGIALALIEKAKSLASVTGARQLSLETGADNKPSHTLYESLGFERDDFFCTYILDL
jgi:ribosomal protein S18 acetylase RimI-like enzyme